MQKPSANTQSSTPPQPAAPISSSGETSVETGSSDNNFSGRNGSGKSARSGKIWLLIVALMVLVLIAIRAALPGWVHDTINQRLADMGAYQGQVDDVDIHLWRGAYELIGLKISSKTEAVSVPFFQVEKIDLSISWRALLRGAVVAEVSFQSPNLVFVDTPNENNQTGKGTDWQEALQRIVPIRINQLDLHNGVIQFRNFHSDPPVDLRIRQVEGTIRDLNNIHRGTGAQPADMSLAGIMLEKSPIVLSGRLDPLGDFRNFHFLLKVTEINLLELNDLAEAYGNFDFQSGSGEFFLELQAKDGHLQGYAKPLLDNVDIVELKEDLEEGVLSTAWEAVVGVLATIFRNQPKDRIASQIDISGSLDESDVSALQAFFSILRNAFVKAYEAGFGEE